MDGLERERQSRHERRQPAGHEPVREERPEEQPPDLARRLLLEDQPGTETHDPQVGVVPLEHVQDPLDVRLLPRVVEGRDAVGRP
jgi:hypothetical protein